MGNEYGINTLVRVSVLFTDNAVPAVPTDPTTVTLKIKAPDGVVTTKTTGDLVHDGDGAYHFDVLANQEGRWFFTYEGDGAVQVSSPDAFFDVSDSVFVP